MLTPTKIAFRFNRDHVVNVAEGPRLVFRSGETFEGWARTWRRSGDPRASEDQRPDLPDYFYLEVHFLREGRSWTYMGEVTPRLLRPGPGDTLERLPPLMGQASGLSDRFDALDPWPSAFPQREKIRPDITHFTYGLTLSEATYRVDLRVAYQYLSYSRPLEHLLFLPACRYLLKGDGSFSHIEEHSADSHTFPTPAHCLTRVLATGDTALIRAAFLARPADLDRAVPGADAAPPVFEAVASNSKDVLDVLLGLGANPNLRFDSPVGTPLHFAVSRDQLSMISRLLAAGADPSLTDSFGETPLHRAAKLGKHEAYDLLVAGGAIETLPAKAGLSASQTRRLHAFHEAIRSGDVSTVLAALESDAQFLIDTEIGGANAMSVAAQCDNSAALDVMAPLSADVNRFIGESLRQQTALHTATGYRHLNSVQVLLRHGADPGIAEPAETDIPTLPAGNYPLHVAASVNSRRIARVLVEAGAQVDARNTFGETALIVACRHLYGRKLVAFLLDAGADPHARSSVGESALQIAKRLARDRKERTRVADLIEERAK